MRKDILATRLAQLTDEFAHARRLLDDNEARAQALRQQMLRLDGAIRVLRDLIADADAGAMSPAGATPPFAANG